jgi:hypothetical protein
MASPTSSWRASHRNFLYRNLGNGHFEDITEKAGLGGAPTGKAMVDFGWLAGLRQ